MLDLPPDIEAMRHLVKKLAGEVDTLKAGLQAANTAIEDLRAEVVNLKTAQIARGHDPEAVEKVQRLLYIAEYKRRQAAPGVKISARNFGRDRRYPIVNKFREELGTSASKGAARATPSDEAPRLVSPRRDGGDMP